MCEFYHIMADERNVTYLDIRNRYRNGEVVFTDSPEDQAAKLLIQIQAMIFHKEAALEILGDFDTNDMENTLANLYLVRETAENVISGFRNEGR